jgi:hypothetical protein
MSSDKIGNAMANRESTDLTLISTNNTTQKSYNSSSNTDDINNVLPRTESQIEDDGNDGSEYSESHSINTINVDNDAPLGLGIQTTYLPLSHSRMKY